MPEKRSYDSSIKKMADMCANLLHLHDGHIGRVATTMEVELLTPQVNPFTIREHVLSLETLLEIAPNTAWLDPSGWEVVA